MTRLRAAALALASVAIAVVGFASLDMASSDRARVTTWDIELIDPAGVESMPAAAARLELFEQRSVGRPPSAPDQRLLGGLLMQQAVETGDDSLFETAEAEYRKGLAMGPHDPANQLGLASALTAQHQFKSGLELIETVLADGPDNLDALAAMGDAYLLLGRYDDAATAHERLARLLSAPAATARLAHLEELHGNPQRALELLESATLEMHRSDALADDLAWYLTRLAELHFQLGNLESRHATQRPRSTSRSAASSRLASWPAPAPRRGESTMRSSPPSAWSSSGRILRSSDSWVIYTRWRTARPKRRHSTLRSSTSRQPPAWSRIARSPSFSPTTTSSRNRPCCGQRATSSCGRTSRPTICTPGRYIVTAVSRPLPRPSSTPCAWELVAPSSTITPA